MLRWVLLSILFCSIVSLSTVAVAQEEHAHGHDEAFAHEHDELPRQQSMLTWYYHSLGLWYSLLLPATGLLSFVLALIVVVRGGPHAGAACILAVALPLLIGAYAAVTGMIMSYNVIAFSMGVPRPSQVAEGYSTALVAPVVAFWVTMPSFLVSLVGLFVRTMIGERVSPKV